MYLGALQWLGVKEALDGRRDLEKRPVQPDIRWISVKDDPRFLETDAGENSVDSADGINLYLTG